MPVDARRRRPELGERGRAPCWCSRMRLHRRKHVHISCTLDPSRPEGYSGCRITSTSASRHCKSHPSRSNKYLTNRVVRRRYNSSYAALVGHYGSVRGDPGCAFMGANARRFIQGQHTIRARLILFRRFRTRRLRRSLRSSFFQPRFFQPRLFRHRTASGCEGRLRIPSVFWHPSNFWRRSRTLFRSSTLPRACFL